MSNDRLNDEVRRAIKRIDYVRNALDRIPRDVVRAFRNSPAAQEIRRLTLIPMIETNDNMRRAMRFAMRDMIGKLEQSFR